VGIRKADLKHAASLAVRNPRFSPLSQLDLAPGPPSVVPMPRTHYIN
jgi:hypothetical protein